MNNICKKDIINTYKGLTETLHKAKDAYYNKHIPIMTDDEYDELERLVIKMENEHPTLIQNDTPTNLIGYDVYANKIKHINKMYSLSNIFSKDDLAKWLSNIPQGVSYLCDKKLDGVSLNLVYEYGILKYGITRGNGVYGENVTNNVKHIKSIPHNIETFKNHKCIEVRGEVVIYKKEFNELRDVFKLDYSTPRNTASGLLRQHSLEHIDKLTFIPYALGYNTLNMKTIQEQMELLKNNHFISNNYEIAYNIDDIMNIYFNILENRNKYDMMLDGMVIKVNDISLHEKIGYTIKYPKYACAYKFPSQEVTSIIKHIEYQIGRSGVITPVAIIEPIKIDNVTIQKVTLHNFNEIKRLKLKLGSKVGVIRSGDVIPKITKTYDDNDATDIILPTRCPSCNNELVISNITKCVNNECKEKNIQQLIYFCSKMKIYGLGSKLVEQLYEHDIVKSYIDIFKLDIEKLLKIEGIENKKANNIMNSINNAKSNSILMLIIAIGIDNVGEKATTILYNKYGKDMLNIKYEDICNEKGIGNETALSYCNYINKNKSMLYELIDICNKG